MVEEIKYEEVNLEPEEQKGKAQENDQQFEEIDMDEVANIEPSQFVIMVHSAVEYAQSYHTEVGTVREGILLIAAVEEQLKYQQDALVYEIRTGGAQ